MLKTIAVMTSGGDAPGMNAAVRAVVRRRSTALSRCTASTTATKAWFRAGIHPGAELGRCRRDPASGRDLPGPAGRSVSGRMKAGTGGAQPVASTAFKRWWSSAAMGRSAGPPLLADEWRGTWRSCVARTLPGPAADEDLASLQVIGLPGSIDNDLFGTDMSIGADTALNHIVEAMDNLSSTAAPISAPSWWKPWGVIAAIWR